MKSQQQSISYPNYDPFNHSIHYQSQLNNNFIIINQTQSGFSDIISYFMYYDFPNIFKQIYQGENIEIRNFWRLFGSKKRLKMIRQKEIKVSGVLALFLSLIKLNVSKFCLTIFLFMIQLAITVTSPLFTNWIIQNYLNSYQQNSLLFLILILLGYKTIKMISSIIEDLCHQSIGNENFAKLQYHVLVYYNTLNGKILNIIEYDCNMISYLAYALLASIFNFIEMVVLIGLLIYYLHKVKKFYLFLIIILLYILSQVIVNYLTFTYNRNYLKRKDFRLNSNIKNESKEDILKKRQQELIFNRKFLNLKIIDKFITIIYPIMINLYVFVIIERQSIDQVQYILLILINLIRVPITNLIFNINLMVQVIYSTNRIISMNRNTLSSPDVPLLCQSLEDQRIQRVQSMKNQQFRSLEAGKNINKQKGNINMRGLLFFCLSNVQGINKNFILCGLCMMLALIGKTYNYFISKHLITNTYNSQDFIGLIYQIIIPLLLYKIITTISSKISNQICVKLQNQTLNCESLNRISGDLYAIDRTMPINMFQFINSFMFILSSYFYSIISLNNIYLQVGLFLFCLSCMIIAFKANRFIMLSRREVSRNQCLLKAKIIKELVQNGKINENKRMKKAWRQIFQCKEMGLMIENYYIGILNLVLIVLSLVFIILSKQLDIKETDKSILLIACLNIDYDLLNMFVAAVRLQISLVSFQRVVNILQP